MAIRRLSFALVLLTCAVTAHAQIITNLDWRVQVETVTAGVTNTATTNFRYDASNKRDALKINGLALAFAKYRADGGTNTFGLWIKQDVAARAGEYAAIKQKADNAALLAKLASILNYNSDVLTAGDFTSLSNIAVKAPAP